MVIRNRRRVILLTSPRGKRSISVSRVSQKEVDTARNRARKLGFNIRTISENKGLSLINKEGIKKRTEGRRAILIELGKKVGRKKRKKKKK